jgi:hypothetical protein
MHLLSKKSKVNFGYLEAELRWSLDAWYLIGKCFSVALKRAWNELSVAQLGAQF